MCFPARSSFFDPHFTQEQDGPRVPRPISGAFITKAAQQSSAVMPSEGGIAEGPLTGRVIPPRLGERPGEQFGERGFVEIGRLSVARPAGGIAGPASGEPPAPVPHSLFPLFYLVEIRHRQLLQ
jgi:hypothetical protein